MTQMDEETAALVDAVVRAHSGYHLHQGDAVRLLRRLGVDQQEAIRLTDEAGKDDVIGRIKAVAAKSEREECAMIADGELMEVHAPGEERIVKSIAEQIRKRT